MRTTDRCHSHDFDKHPRLVRRPMQSSLRPWLRCVARFHGAPHAEANCSRSVQGVFSPAVVALEQPTSDAPVTHPSHVIDFAMTLGETGPDRFHCPLVKKEQLLRPEAPFIDRRSATATPLRMPSPTGADPAVLPPRPDPRCRFARRGLPLWASPRSPLARLLRHPGSFFGHSALVERLLQHDTKRGHTLRALWTSHVWTSRSQDTLSLATPLPVARAASDVRILESLKALRPKRLEDVSPLLREGTCTPTEGTESEEPQVAAFLRTSHCSRAPARRVSSTPLSSMRAPGPWRDPPLRTNRGSASSAHSAKRERLLLNRGAFHRQDRSREEDRSSYLRTAGLLLT